MTLETIIKQLKTEFKSFSETHSKRVKELELSIKEISEVSSNFESNWAGAWAAASFNYYYENDDSAEFQELTTEEIWSVIESKKGLNIDEMKEEILNINKEYKDLQLKFSTELSCIRSDENLTAEIDILNNIENQGWGISPSSYIKSKQPKTVMTYDPFILNKGIETPPHIVVSADLMSFYSMLVSMEAFEKNIYRIIRQIEIKLSLTIKPTIDNDFLPKVFNRFHDVVNQLQNRYNDRDTIVVNDEYDVQDLFHSILKIQFDDIRAEEYTPSYAGGSTRVDFLLKKEKIVIEIKKTRKGLTDKEVGNQLILDSQHYRVHPDCKRLICFVYDPENKIRNPRGLESDLNELSNEELIVEAYIRP